MGSLRGSAGKEPACQCRRHKRCGFHLWVGKIPWRRKWRPTPVFLPGTSRGRRSLESSSPWGRRESDTTELAQKAAKNDKLRNPRFSYSSSSSEWTTQMFQSWKEPRALRTGSALPRRAVRLRPQFKPGPAPLAPPQFCGASHSVNPGLGGVLAHPAAAESSGYAGKQSPPSKQRVTTATANPREDGLYRCPSRTNHLYSKRERTLHLRSSVRSLHFIPGRF